MSITLILHGKQRRGLRLPKQRLAWVGGILFTVLALGAAGSGRAGGRKWRRWSGADLAQQQNPRKGR